MIRPPSPSSPYLCTTVRRPRHREHIRREHLHLAGSVGTRGLRRWLHGSPEGRSRQIQPGARKGRDERVAPQRRKEQHTNPSNTRPRAQPRRPHGSRAHRLGAVFDECGLGSGSRNGWIQPLAILRPHALLLTLAARPRPILGRVVPALRPS